MSAARDACLAMLKGKPDQAGAWWARIGQGDRREVCRMAGLDHAAPGFAWEELTEADRDAIRSVHDRLKTRYFRLRAMFDFRGAAGVAA